MVRGRGSRWRELEVLSAEGRCCLSGCPGLAGRRTAGGAVSEPFILGPGERHAGAPPLERPWFRFASGQTGGLAALAEVRLPPLTAGPDLHVHANEDEMFFVLEGVMTVQVGS